MNLTRSISCEVRNFIDRFVTFLNISIWKEKSVNFIQKNALGLVICLAIAIPAWFLGKLFPIVGGAVIAILMGMLISLFWTNKGKAAPGISFSSRQILQLAVVFLGFGLDLQVVLKTGLSSLPVIISTIGIALIVAFLLQKALKMPANISVLIGVGSSICGGSAIAATAPVIKAKDNEVAQAISVIFFFNVLAALIFPTLGNVWGFISSADFGLFAGTAVNDTSSVTAAAATWDNLHHFGAKTLDTAVTVKLTRTLAIIPITMVLSFIYARKAEGEKSTFSLKRALPLFIVFFIAASCITTVVGLLGIDSHVFSPLKTLSKFLIVMAMAAIGLSSNLVQLIKSGAKPLFLGASCWVAITAVSLAVIPIG